MSLIFADSFDHYAADNDFGGKWDIAGRRLPGRRGTLGVQPNLITGMLKNVANRPYLICGFAVFCATSGGRIRDDTDSGAIMLQFLNDGIVYISIAISSDGKIRVSRGGYPDVSNADGPSGIGGASSTPLWTSAANVWPFVSWNFLEFKANFNYSGGSWALRLNGVTLHSADERTIPYGYVASPAEVGNTVNPVYATQVKILTAGDSASFTIDDFYLLNNLNGVNDDFLGDLQVDLIRPDGAGLRSDSDIVGTAPEATRWESERTFDHGVSAVQLNAEGDSDSYTYEDLPYDQATIFGVQVTSLARKSDGGLARIAVTNDVNGQAADGVPALLSPSAGNVYACVHGEFDESADGPWTLDLVQDSEFGIRRDAATP